MKSGLLKQCQKVMITAAFLILSPMSLAALLSAELQEMQQDCNPSKRYFTLSPAISYEACIVVNGFNTYGHSLPDLERLYGEIAIDKDDVFQATLSELNFLSKKFKEGKLTYAANLTQQIRGVFTKDLITRNLFLLNSLLKEKSSETLSAEDANGITEALINVVSGIGDFLYSYDLMTFQCGANSHCPRVLFMAPVLWTSIAHKVDRYHQFSEIQFTQLLPVINNMLESHSQVSAGLPVYIQVTGARTALETARDKEGFLIVTAKDDPQRIHPMDQANKVYTTILSVWNMKKDFHDTEYSAVTFKEWGYMQDPKGFRLNLPEVLAHADNAFRHAELSQKKALELLSRHGRNPIKEKLAESPSFALEMFYGIGNRTMSGRALDFIGSFEEYSTKEPEVASD